jgi:GDSL-like Lipase/Acylhydrolase family
MGIGGSSVVAAGEVTWRLVVQPSAIGGGARCRRLILAVALLALSVAGLARAQPAQAIIVVPYFEAHPAVGELGAQFTINLAWPSGTPGVPPHRGCSDPVEYSVSGPGPDPENGDYGPVVANGTLDANVRDNDGTLISYGTATFTPTAVGSYFVLLNGGPPACIGSVGPVSGSFEVTPSTGPQDTLTLTPEAQTRSVDNLASVTATLTSGATGAPISGTGLSFAVTGPNGGVTGSCVPASCATDSNGKVTWSYAGQSTGHDTVNAEVGPPDGQGVTGQATVDWTASLNGTVFAALGDSFSAGEGTGVYLDGTDVAGRNMCHRSVLAYGSRLSRRFNLTDPFGFVACSGAVTDDFFSENNAVNRTPGGSVEPAQLCLPDPLGSGKERIAACGDARLPIVGPKTKLITLTIGGNDAGFGWVVSKCGWGSALHGNFGRPGRNCSFTQSVVEPTNRRLLALAGVGSAFTPASASRPQGAPIHSFSATLRAIHSAAPNARVYIAGYPRLFQVTNNRDCVIGQARLPGGAHAAIKVTPYDAAWLDAGAALVNELATAAAARAGRWATFVNVAGRFSGHGICSTNPWLNPVSATVTPLGNELVTAVPGSLHPTVEGQNAYEHAFAAAGFPAQ